MVLQQEVDFEVRNQQQDVAQHTDDGHGNQGEPYTMQTPRHAHLRLCVRGTVMSLWLIDRQKNTFINTYSSKIKQPTYLQEFFVKNWTVFILQNVQKL